MKKSRKNQQADNTVVLMSTAVAVNEIPEINAALLNELNLEDAADEIVEITEVTDDGAAQESEIEAAVALADREDTTEAQYAEQTPTVVSDGTAPATTETTVVEKKKKGAPRNAFAKKSEKIASKLGEKASEFLILDVNDASLDDAALKVKQEEVLASVDVLAKKVGEKAVMLFDWVKNGGDLNEVMKRTFQVLHADGKLTSGDKGNLQQNLLSKPYSMGTARSQANQMFMLLPALKVTTKVKGEMIPNPNSTIWIKAQSELGLK